MNPVWSADVELSIRGSSKTSHQSSKMSCNMPGDENTDRQFKKP